MRYLSILMWSAVVAGAPFLGALGLLSAGGWAECDKGDCGAVGELVYWAYRVLAWPAAALVVPGGAAVLVALLRGRRI